MKKTDKEPDVVYIQPIRIEKILTQIGETLLHLSKENNDRHFFTDNYKDWKDKKTKYTNRSVDKEDKQMNKEQDIDKICRDIIQVSLFDRILETDEEGVTNNLPKLHFPFYMRQFLRGKDMDLYNISSFKTFEYYDMVKRKK